MKELREFNGQIKDSLNKKVLVLIPCHNEEASIAKTIREVLAVIPEAKILVVDNVSDDLTSENAKKAGALVIKEPQKGKGFAVRRAFSQIDDQIEVVFMLDGDATYAVEGFWKAYDLIVKDGFDMVVGKRTIEIDPHDSRGQAFRFGHKLGNHILSRTFSSMFGLAHFDTLSGWRVMSMGYVKSFPGGASGFELEAELNSHAHLLKAAVCEIPINYRGRMAGSTSKLSTYKDGARILRMNMGLFRAEKPLIAYSILGLPWLLFSTILVIRVVEVFFQKQTVPNFPSLIAGVGAFVIASLLWVTGMILEKVRLTRVAIARWAYMEATRKL